MKLARKVEGSASKAFKKLVKRRKHKGDKDPLVLAEEGATQGPIPGRSIEILSNDKNIDSHESADPQPKTHSKYYKEKPLRNNTDHNKTPETTSEGRPEKALENNNKEFAKVKFRENTEEDKEKLLNENEITVLSKDEKKKKKKRKKKKIKKKVKKTTWRVMKGTWKYMKAGIVLFSYHNFGAMNFGNVVDNATKAYAEQKGYTTSSYDASRGRHYTTYSQR